MSILNVSRTCTEHGMLFSGANRLQKRFDSIDAVNAFIKGKTGETLEQRADKYAHTQEKRPPIPGPKGGGNGKELPNQIIYRNRLYRLTTQHMLKLVRELVKPETQLSEQNQKLFLFKPSPILPTFLVHDIDLNNKQADD